MIVIIKKHLLQKLGRKKTDAKKGWALYQFDFAISAFLWQSFVISCLQDVLPIINTDLPFLQPYEKWNFYRRSMIREE